MIQIYRVTRYPDHDNIIFQASDETAQLFKRQFPVRIQDTRLGFEPGYYTWLRDDYRDRFYDRILAFFRYHFQPPELTLSCFMTNRGLSAKWSPDIWKEKIDDAIRAELSKKDYTTQVDKYANVTTVIPSQPFQKIENVEVHWAAQYRVDVSDDLQPQLWCNDHFLLFMDGQAVGLREISQVHGNGSDVLGKLRSCTTRNAEEQFKRLTNFIKCIPALPQCEGIQFNPEPVSAEDINFQTWFWLHDTDAYFETSAGLRTNLTQAILSEGSGCFVQPDDIQVVVLTPETDANTAIPKIDWGRVAIDSERLLNQAMPEEEVPFIHRAYPPSGDLSAFLKALKQEIEKNDSRRVLCLLTTPPSEARFSQNEKLIALEQQTFQLNRQLRDIAKGGYTATVDWSKLGSSKDRPYVINNSLLSGLFKLGALPWRIGNLPFENEFGDENYFLGLTANVTERYPAIAATLINQRGEIIAYGGIYLDEQANVNSFETDLQNLLGELIKKGLHHSQPKISHLIVHVNSELTNYRTQISESLNELGISHDLLQIQNSDIRFLQLTNNQGTPSHGIAVGDDKTQVAYLMNTLSPGEKTDRGFIYPNPNTITVRKLIGTTSLKSLSAQVFWLSNGHIHSLHRTVDTPLTLSYAEALLNHIRKTRRSMRVTRNYKRTLYWL